MELKTCRYSSYDRGNRDKRIEMERGMEGPLIIMVGEFVREGFPEKLPQLVLVMKDTSSGGIDQFLQEASFQSIQ